MHDVEYSLPLSDLGSDRCRAFSIALVGNQNADSEWLDALVFRRDSSRRTSRYAGYPRLCRSWVGRPMAAFQGEAERTPPVHWPVGRLPLLSVRLLRPGSIGSVRPRAVVSPRRCGWRAGRVPGWPDGAGGVLRCAG